MCERRDYRYNRDPVRYNTNSYYQRSPIICQVQWYRQLRERKKERERERKKEREREERERERKREKERERKRNNIKCDVDKKV